MTMAKNGFSAQAPKLRTMTGAIGSEVALVVASVVRSKLSVSAEELNMTTLPTMQSEKMALGTTRLGSNVSSAMVEQASKPMKAHPAIARAARNAAVWPGAVLVTRFRKSSPTSWW